MKRYEIYPKVRQIVYLENSFELKDEINLVINSEIDEFTYKKVKDIFSEYKISESEEFVSDKTNVMLNTNTESHITNRYLKDFDPEKFDAYKLTIKDGVIAIVGKDSDAIFCGLVTLEHILNQIEDGKIEELLINDFASQGIRGVIEGYYGIPWGNENREELLKFGGKFKNNAFVFAPKDDPYHREKWRELYPENLLEEFAHLAKVGNENKNRFVWTITPFKNEPINDENVDESIKDLLAKFDQLYSAGIRQFGILGDDVGELPYETVVKTVNAASEWIDSKEDKVYDLIFVPQNYTLGDWGGRDIELPTYEKGFNENVQIVFTGETVLAPVTQDAIDRFKNINEEVTLRDPLFWLNWPVNDIDRARSRRLFLGKGEMLENGVKNLNGVLTNPLEEAHASLISIFAIADYTWNSEAFDAQQSWEDSFKYIDPDAHEELKIIATHMAATEKMYEDTNEGGGITGLEESEELNKINEEFYQALESGNNVKEAADKLISEYKIIADAVDSFMEKSNYSKLKLELSPYILSLKGKAEAAILLIKSILVKNEYLDDDHDHLYNEAIKKYQDSKTHMVHTMTSEFPSKELNAESGTKYIRGHIEKMIEMGK